MHIGTNHIGRKGDEILQNEYSDLGIILKSRTSGLLPVPCASEAKNRKVGQMNASAREQGFKILDHCDLFRDRCNCIRESVCI